MPGSSSCLFIFWTLGTEISDCSIIALRPVCRLGRDVIVMCRFGTLSVPLNPHPITISFTISAAHSWHRSRLIILTVSAQLNAKSGYLVVGALGGGVGTINFSKPRM